jgi:AAA+ superfamily predicted ATPase
VLSWKDEVCAYTGGSNVSASKNAAKQVEQAISTFREDVSLWLGRFTPQYVLPVVDTWYDNILALKTTLRLNEVETSLLRFSVAKQMVPTLQQTVTTKCTYGLSTAADHCLMLGDVFAVPPEQIRKCLAPSGVLLRSSLLSFKYSKDGDTSLEINESLFNAILTGTPETLFSSFFSPTYTTQLAESDFDYCADRLALLKTYLRHALETKQKGVNVMLYGPPGVGKSELAKVMAQALGMPLYQVAEEDEDKSAKDRDSRLTAYCLTQEVLHHGPPALILFDEVEDIFVAPHSEANSAQRAKGFVNRLLEVNAVPTFWITNSCDDMDAAVLRRFALVLRMVIPPRATRLKIAQHYFRKVGNPPDYLLDVDLTAADFARIAGVAEVIHADDSSRTANSIALMAEEYLRLFGEQHKILPIRNGVELPFDPALCNCKADLQQLETALKRHPAAVLLVGPAGSGKGAVARHLGEQLGLVVDKSASDLISDHPWHTVATLRALFDQWRREGAVGLIENADIFFRATRDSDTLNTLMTDSFADLLSRHTGTVFVCCTGSVQNLPLALLNCFEVKIEFETLTAAHCQKYLAAACRVPVEALQNGLSRRVASLAGIVPQNVTTVLHRAQLFDREVTPEYLIGELEQEVAFTKEGGRKAGF